MAVKKKDKSIKKNADEKKNKKEVKSTNNKDSGKKQSLWVRFRIFCHGVKSETSRVHWPNKKIWLNILLQLLYLLFFVHYSFI